MIPIILDQGLPRTAANLLRHEGWDVLHTGDIGLGSASDSEILDFARKESRLKGPDLASLIKTIWPRIEPHLRKGAMVSVNEAGIRIKNIPVISP